MERITGAPPASRPVPATIGMLFGGLWAMLGAQSLPAGLQAVALAAAGVATLALLVHLWRRRDARPRQGAPFFRRRAYLSAVALEIAAIAAASAALPRLGLQDFLIPVVGIIVGLHFIGLWLATGARSFLAVCAGMCAVSCLAMLAPELMDGIGLRNAVAGFGNAIVLWIGASWPVSAAAPRGG